MSASITTIGYRDRTDQPWPRILQFIAIVTIIYGAARIGVNIPEVQFLWRTYGISAYGPQLFLMTAIQSLFELIIGLLLIIGAIHLIRSGSQRLILAGHWAIVVLWFVEVIAGSALRPGRVTLLGLFYFITIAIHLNIFPIMVILILRARHAR